MILFRQQNHLLYQLSGDNVELPFLQPSWHELHGLRIPVEGSDKAHLSKVFVFVHCYYVDGLNGLLGLLQHVKPIQCLHLTTCSQENAIAIKAITQKHGSIANCVNVEVVENKGRDQLPFWLSLKTTGKDCDFFIKLHLKKSPQLDHAEVRAGELTQAEAWMRHLFSCLLPGNDENINALFSWMDCHNVGAVFPLPWQPRSNHGWGSMKLLEHAYQLCMDLHVDPYRLYSPLVFPVGNMFIGSVPVFLEWADYFSRIDLYDDEPIPFDGTLLHAMERIYGNLLHAKNISFAVISPVAVSNQASASLCIGRDLVVFPATEDKATPLPGTCAFNHDTTLAFYREATRLWNEKVALETEVFHLRDEVSAYRSSVVIRSLQVLKSSFSKLKRW